MRVLVTGASGQLGAYLIDALLSDGHEPIAWSGSDAGSRSGIRLRSIDLTDLAGVRQTLERDQPDAIVHLAAISSAAGVLNAPDLAETVNVAATAVLADWCSAHHRRLIFSSTDLVFSGERSWNREGDHADPRLAYGRTKRSAEDFVLATPLGLVARLPLMYGPSRCGRTGFFDQAIQAFHRGEPRSYFADEFRTPLDYDSVASILARVLKIELAGILHVAGAERVSRFDLMQTVAEAMGLDPSLVLANRRADAPGPEPRPADVSLDTGKLSAQFTDLIRPSIEEAVASWC
ncbi:MAG: dTDP-4-dehydrorhamnose reductase [Planctomycetota bacterium]|nr:dTDP-4-dehydrorhamnose reductase [Planctomycetota bacterium]